MTHADVHESMANDGVGRQADEEHTEVRAIDTRVRALVPGYGNHEVGGSSATNEQDTSLAKDIGSACLLRPRAVRHFLVNVQIPWPRAARKNAANTGYTGP